MYMNKGSEAYSRAVFLDKDGTLIDDLPYNVDPALIKLRDGVGTGLHLLYKADYCLVIVSNQSGVARGLFPEESLLEVEAKLTTLLRPFGVELHGFYYCPHFLGGSVSKYSISCDCRKPRPGLLLKSAVEMRIDLSGSWLIGNSLDDIEAGHRAGCRTILLESNYTTSHDALSLRVPDYYATDLESAAGIILSNPQPKVEPASDPEKH
jgi:D-glycero-D-manno-heptose 1,7-bisphosphate phosphatase